MWYVTVVSPRWHVSCVLWGSRGVGHSLFLSLPSLLQLPCIPCDVCSVHYLDWLWNMQSYSALSLCNHSRLGEKWHYVWVTSSVCLMWRTCGLYRLFVPARLAVVMCYRCLFRWEAPSALYPRYDVRIAHPVGTFLVPHCVLCWSWLPATWEF